jgi:uncharacterized repeat protein (TIGR03803 family)
MGVISFFLCIATAAIVHGQTFNTLVNFDLTNGASPAAQLVQGPDGSLYGTSTGGGAYGGGTVFKVPADGVLTTLYSFCAEQNCPDGSYPEGTLVLGTDGHFYGTTLQGGNTICPDSCGTLFKITPAGKLTTIY